MKTKDFRFDNTEGTKSGRPLKYLRIEGRREVLAGKYLGSIHTKAEAKKLIKLLKKTEFWR